MHHATALAVILILACAPLAAQERESVSDAEPRLGTDTATGRSGGDAGGTGVSDARPTAIDDGPAEQPAMGYGTSGIAESVEPGNIGLESNLGAPEPSADPAPSGPTRTAPGPASGGAGVR